MFFVLTVCFAYLAVRFIDIPFLYHDLLLQSRQNWILRSLLDSCFLISASCFTWLRYRAFVWFYEVWLFFFNCVVLQPCGFVDVISCGLLGCFSLGVDKYNPMIGLHSYLYDPSLCDLANYFSSDFCIDVFSSSFLCELSCADWNTLIHHVYLLKRSTS